MEGHTTSRKQWMYIKEYADLQIALDRLNDPADPVISLQEMRNKLEL